MVKLVSEAKTSISACSMSAWWRIEYTVNFSYEMVTQLPTKTVHSDCRKVSEYPGGVWFAFHAFFGMARWSAVVQVGPTTDVARECLATVSPGLVAPLGEEGEVIDPLGLAAQGPSPLV